MYKLPGALTYVAHLSVQDNDVQVLVDVVGSICTASLVLLFAIHCTFLFWDCTRTYDSLEVTRKIKLTHCTVRIVSMLCENGAGLIFN